MLEVAPVNALKGEVRVSPIGRARKRKSWEFTWDDVKGTSVVSCESAFSFPVPVLRDRAEATNHTVREGERVIESRRKVPERRTRKRKAWEFTWDDRQDSPIVVNAAPIVEPQASSSEAGVVLTGASEISVRDSALSAAPLEPGMARDRLPVESLDVDRVRKQLLALGTPAEEGKQATAQDEVSWIRPRRSRHEVQVVHLRSGARRSAQEMPETPGVDSSLHTDPLISNAFRVVSLLRKSHEDENVIALRRAVRELREQVAGLEAQAYAKPSRPEIPLFKQVYDPKTRTG